MTAVPAFLSKAGSDAPKISDQSLNEAQSQFQRLSQVITNRNYGTDVETKVIALSAQLSIIFSLLTSLAQR